jgi:hypothetical protein
MDLPDRGQERGISGRTGPHRAIVLGVLAGRRDLEHGSHQPRRIGTAAVLDEAEAHVRVPAEVAIDFLKMSRSSAACWIAWPYSKELKSRKVIN